MITIVVKKPASLAETLDIEPTIQEFERLVGGPHTIDCQHELDDGYTNASIHMYRRQQPSSQPPNVVCKDSFGPVINGPVFIIKYDCATCTYESLTPTQANQAIEFLNGISATW